jgi:hypothetical protein
LPERQHPVFRQIGMQPAVEMAIPMPCRASIDKLAFTVADMRTTTGPGKPPGEAVPPGWRHECDMAATVWRNDDSGRDFISMSGMDPATDL